MVRCLLHAPRTAERSVRYRALCGLEVCRVDGVNSELAGGQEGCDADVSSHGRGLVHGKCGNGSARITGGVRGVRYAIPVWRAEYRVMSGRAL